MDVEITQATYETRWVATSTLPPVSDDEMALVARLMADAMQRKIDLDWDRWTTAQALRSLPPMAPTSSHVAAWRPHIDKWVPGGGEKSVVAELDALYREAFAPKDAVQTTINVPMRTTIKKPPLKRPRPNPTRKEK